MSSFAVVIWNFVVQDLFISSKPMGHKKRCEIPLTLVELEDMNYHILASSVVQTGDTCRWIIDTGASKSVFDAMRPDVYTEIKIVTEEIQSAGIGEEPIKTGVGQIDLIDFGTFKLFDFPVALIDFTQINKLYKRYAHIQIQGLLGSDFLLEHRAVINYRTLKLSIII